ncbi:MAG: 4Fe-4S binding protein [Candidatus Bathyarchaeia archaeon]
MPIKVDAGKCDGCGVCVEICPMDALRMRDDEPHLKYDECWYCGACVEDCPRHAIRLELPYLIS